MARSSRSRVGGRADLETATVWVVGACVVSGSAAGFLVGWLYGRDDTTSPSDVPWYAAAGLLVGLVLGLLVSIGSIVLLVVVDGRSWASARPLRAVLAAAGAMLPILLVLLMTSGFSVAPEAVAFCAVVAGLPAGLATAFLDWRAGRTDRPRAPTVRPVG